MAIITITLDTAQGDTLEKALASIAPPPMIFPRSIDTTVDLNKFAKPGGYYFVDHGKPLAAPGLPHVVSSPPDNRDPTPKVFPYVTTEAKHSAATTRPESNETAAVLGRMDGDRKRGEAGPGHRRRTNRQIEEDERYFAQIKMRGEAAVAAMEQGVEGHREARPTIAASTETQSNSAELNSVDNEDGALLATTDDAAREARREAGSDQDAADETAEAAASHGPEPTLDDLRKVVGRYQKKFGMAQAARRIPELLGMPIFEVPTKDIGVCIHKVEAAIEFDPLDGARFTPAANREAEKPAETIPAAGVPEVIQAIKDYAMKFDGVVDKVRSKCTNADIPRILADLFGRNVITPADIPAKPENYDKAIAAIRANIDKNTFGRVAK